ncbi:phosphotransferase [Nitrincola sp.]|uniref:phosphotransferase n=1 Tax=Nitrincola sp. TaxID=1926584 RepID=UPI003A8F617C
MTDLRHHLSAILPQAVRDHLPPIQSMQFLGQGSRNRHWRLHTAEQVYIWREFGVTPPGANRQLELKVLETLQPKPWVPRLELCLPEGVLFVADANAEPMQDTLNPHQRQQLLHAVVTLWQHPFDVAPNDYVQLIHDYAVLAGPSYDALAEQLLAICCHWNTKDFCLIHQDLHPGNLLITDQGIQLIDWEYAVRGNPWIDAVALQRMLGLSPAERQLLETRLPDLGCNDPWQVMGHWLTQLDSLWQAAQKAQSVV